MTDRVDVEAMDDGAKLRLLADWFDYYDRRHDNRSGEIQAELRRIASRLEAVSRAAIRDVIAAEKELRPAIYTALVEARFIFDASRILEALMPVLWPLLDEVSALRAERDGLRVKLDFANDRLHDDDVEISEYRECAEAAEAQVAALTAQLSDRHNDVRVLNNERHLAEARAASLQAAVDAIASDATIIAVAEQEPWGFPRHRRIEIVRAVLKRAAASVPVPSDDLVGSEEKQQP